MQKMWCVLAAMIRHRKCRRKTTVVAESDSDSSVVGLDFDENDVSEISISDNNVDTEENIEIQFAMPILESISDMIQSPFTDLYQICQPILCLYFSFSVVDI